MRPVRLELEGFTSYRARTVVDFTDADLFVFTGATGSGKSSLIDAMVFALYGSVPRYENQSLVAPLISQGKVRTKVRLDFEVGGRAYTAVRVVQRTKAGATTKEARLERRDGDRVQTLAATAPALTEKVQRDVIGLSLDHFTKCVVLPQGEFAAFLRAKPAARKDLLERLLGLGLYERLRREANQRWREQESRAGALQAQLESGLAHATSEAVAEAKAQVDVLLGLRSHIEEVSGALDALDGDVRAADETMARLERQQELLANVRIPEGTEVLADACRRAREELERASKARELAGRDVRRARTERAELPERAAIEEVLEKWSELDRRQTEITRTRSDLGEAAEVAARAAQHEKTVQEELAEARVRLNVLPAKGDLEAVRRDRERLAALEKEAEHTRTRLAEVEEAFIRASADEEALSDELARIRRRVDALPEQGKLETHLEQWRRLARAEEDAGRARDEVEQAERAHAAARARNAAAARELSVVNTEVASLRRAHGAADMARHLREGEACPVCLQSVVQLPGHDVPADLESAEAAQKEAQETCARTQRRLERSEMRRVAAEATVAHREEQVESLCTVLAGAPRPEEATGLLAVIARAEAAAGDVEKSLRKARLGREQRERRRDAAGATLNQQETFAASLRAALAGKAALDRIAVLLNDIRVLEAEVRSREEEVGRAATGRTEAERRLNALSAALSEQKKFLAALRAGLAEAPEPEEAAALLGRIRMAEGQVTAAEAGEAEAERARLEAKRTLGVWQTRIETAWQEYRSARDRVAGMRPPTPFEGDLATSWSALSEWAREERADAERTLEAVTAERARASSERRRRESELRSHCRSAGLEAGPDELLLNVCLLALGDTRRKLSALRSAAEERKRVGREAREARRRASVAKELGSHLGAKKFGAWLQNRILAWLVGGATTRLRELSSDQYSLALTGKNDFLVIDHANADEPRLAKTLSGGETFLASLALALSLAEQVAHLSARQNTRLEALFLDEGFGTLDSETLEVVAATIEQLGTERMVGIVTHVPELADRILVQFQVTKRGNSSSVERVEV